MEKQIIYEGLTFVPYLENDKICQRIKELGKQISEDYRGREPVMICVLNGSLPFAADLFRAFEGDAEIAFIRVSSYNFTKSTGEVKQLVPLTADIKSRDVIIIEDIVDTGNTIVQLNKILAAYEPASIRLATLLFKKEALLHDVKPDYVGFDIPNKFIIGFGLDINNKARNLPDIWAVKE